MARTRRVGRVHSRANSFGATYITKRSRVTGLRKVRTPNLKRGPRRAPKMRRR